MIFDPKPVELKNVHLLLRPMQLQDAEGLFVAGSHPELWRWVTPYKCETLGTTREWINVYLKAQQTGRQLPFVIVDPTNCTICGSTQYYAISRENRSLEIGHTFLSPQYQRTYVNTLAKYMLLKHAFEDLGAVRVGLRTHENNQKSRNAIGRIGATFEGILRKDRIQENGQTRNTALFSIVDSEWPQVKKNLQDNMRSYQFSVWEL